MTNWDLMRDAVHRLFPRAEPKDVGRYVWQAMCDDDHICKDCALLERCLHTYFQTDKNGEYIRTEDGDYIPNDDWCGCDKLVEAWLMEEAKTDFDGGVME